MFFMPIFFVLALACLFFFFRRGHSFSVHQSPKYSPASSNEAFPTSEVRALFDDWATQVESEVLTIVKQKGEVNPGKIAQELKISEDSALFFISKLIRDKKIIVTTIQLVS